DLARGLRDAVSEYEVHRFFNAKLSADKSAIFQPARDALVRALVFLPDTHIGALAIRGFRDLLPSSALFKCGTHIKRRTFDRQHHGKQTLASPPAYAGEVVERGAFGQENGVKIIRLHEPPGFFLSLVSLLRRDRLGLATH